MKVSKIDNKLVLSEIGRTGSLELFLRYTDSTMKKITVNVLDQNVWVLEVPDINLIDKVFLIDTGTLKQIPWLHLT